MATPPSTLQTSNEEGGEGCWTPMEGWPGSASSTQGWTSTPSYGVPQVVYYNEWAVPRRVDKRKRSMLLEPEAQKEDLSAPLPLLNGLLSTDEDTTSWSSDGCEIWTEGDVPPSYDSLSEEEADDEPADEREDPIIPESQA